MKKYDLDIDYLMSLSELDRARKIVLIVFRDVVDKAGAPYLRHLRVVSESFSDSDGKVVALLHDLVEDTTFTFDDLISLGFSNYIVDTLRLVTNDIGDYDEYVDRLIKSDNMLAKKVKMADLLDNMNLNRFEELNQKNFERVRNKYIKTYQKLIDDLERRICND